MESFSKEKSGFLLYKSGLLLPAECKAGGQESSWLKEAQLFKISRYTLKVVLLENKPAEFTFVFKKLLHYILL
jgi:hypothetical protein